MLTVLFVIYFRVVPAKNNVDFVFFLMLELTAEAASAIWWPDFPHISPEAFPLELTAEAASAIWWPVFPHISPEAFPHFLPFGTRIRIKKKTTFLT